MNSFRYLIGIDEAGRGPLAGPVSVGVACVTPDFSWDKIPGVNDSKKLTEKKREAVFERAVQLKEEKKLFFAVCLVSASDIDRIGIVPSVKKAMHRALALVQKELQCDPERCSVKLDGSLQAPAAYVHQETIIKGDAKEKIIGLASILAKVTRDRYMCAHASKEKYQQYDFSVHKGYGTKAHREHIRKLGLTDLHRVSFCRALIHK